MRVFATAILAVGFISVAACALMLHPQAASPSGSPQARSKPQKQFSYLSIDMGVQFNYPSRYTLVAVSPPKTPAEAAYRWKVAATSHGPGGETSVCGYACTVRVYPVEFSLAAMYAGITRQNGKWVAPGSSNGRGHSAAQFDPPKLIAGKGWKGLVETFHGRLRSASGKDLGMEEGETIVAGNDGTASVVMNFFPARGTAELRKSILASLKFLSPKPIDTRVTRLFRNEKLGVEFKYQAAYKLSAMKPFPPPGAASDSLPVEAAYELKLPVPPCCAGVRGLPFSVQDYIFILKLDFLSAAKGLGFAKDPRGEWTYKDEGAAQKAEGLSGNGWKGLRMTYNFRLYPAASAWEEAQGLSSGSGYLGASEGEKTLISDGGNRSVVVEFDPDWEFDPDVKKTYDTILKSLRFIVSPPKPR